MGVQVGLHLRAYHRAHGSLGLQSRSAGMHVHTRYVVCNALDSTRASPLSALCWVFRRSVVSENGAGGLVMMLVRRCHGVVAARQPSWLSAPSRRPKTPLHYPTPFQPPTGGLPRKPKASRHLRTIPSKPPLVSLLAPSTQRGGQGALDQPPLASQSAFSPS